MRTAFALAATFVICGCGGGDSSSHGADIPFTTVARTSSSGVTALEGVVARSQAEFNAVWARYSQNMSPAPQPPSVDFGSMQVVGVFLGTRPYLCYSVTITRVRQSDGRLLVSYKEDSGSLCSPSLAYPAHLVAVQASQLQVEFVAE
jgi:hypothetical protein